MSEGDVAAAAAGGDDCRNCGAALHGPYCSRCGQAVPAPRDYSLRALAGELVDQLTSVDAKLPRTLWALVSRPGALTREHLAGRRACWIRPLQLFLLVNLLLFLVAPRVPFFSYSLQNYIVHAPPSPRLVTAWVRRAVDERATAPGTRGEGREMRAYAAAFDARAETLRKSLIVLFVPAIALVLRLLFVGRRDRAGVPRRYGEHLVFATHLLAFVWLALAASYGLVSVARPSGTAGRVALLVVVFAMLLATPVYTLLALRRAYLLQWAWSAAGTAALVGSFALALAGYRALMFFITYWTL